MFRLNTLDEIIVACFNTHILTFIMRDRVPLNRFGFVIQAKCYLVFIHVNIVIGVCRYAKSNLRYKPLLLRLRNRVDLLVTIIFQVDQIYIGRIDLNKPFATIKDFKTAFRHALKHCTAHEVRHVKPLY